MDVNKEVNIYAITAVSFGDQPAGNIATMALGKTAEMEMKKYPLVTDMIIKTPMLTILLIVLKLLKKHQS